MKIGRLLPERVVRIVVCASFVLLGSLCSEVQAQDPPTPTPTAAPPVKISGIDDIEFGSYSGAGDLVSVPDDLCVSNKLGSSYRVVFTTSTGSFSFVAGAQTFPFTLEFMDGSNTYSTITSGDYNQPMSFSGASSAEDCNGSSNARYRITISKANLLAAKVLTSAGVSFGVDLSIKICPAAGGC